MTLDWMTTANCAIVHCTFAFCNICIYLQSTHTHTYTQPKIHNSKAILFSPFSSLSLFLCFIPLALLLWSLFLLLFVRWFRILWLYWPSCFCSKMLGRNDSCGYDCMRIFTCISYGHCVRMHRWHRRKLWKASKRHIFLANIHAFANSNWPPRENMDCRWLFPKIFRVDWGIGFLKRFLKTRLF